MPDPNFSLDRHVRQMQVPNGNLNALIGLSATLMRSAWDWQHPLWEVFLLQPPRGPSSLWIRAHRASLPWEDEAVLLNALLTPQPSVLRRGAQHESQQNPSAIPPEGERTASAVRAVQQFIERIRRTWLNTSTVQPYVEAVAATLRAVLIPPPSISPFNGELSGRFDLAALSVDVNQLREIRNRAGGTLLEILLSSILGGLERALSGPALPTLPHHLVVLVPLTSGSEQDARRLGTRSTLAAARLPLMVQDPVHRLRRVSAELDLLRATGATDRFRRALAVIRSLPQPALGAVVDMLPRAAPVHTICTELPSLRERRYVAGAQVLEVLPFASPLLGVRVVFTLQTYADRVGLGIAVDLQCPLRAERLARSTRAALDELGEALGIGHRGLSSAEHTMPRSTLRAAVPKATQASRKSKTKDDRLTRS
ncbi:MAG: putative diacyglycerol O-acyltransferase tgs1 [Candidatus Binatia bacterium]|nr:MAG: putative diacyglycerol O-acyltransferase tgs1 [Candidatus Binatia bacterium]